MSIESILLWAVGAGLFWMIVWSIKPASRKPGNLNHTDEVTWGLIFMVIFAVVAAGGSLLAGSFSWGYVVAIAVSYAVALYLARVGTYYIRTWRYNRWLRKQHQQELVERLTPERPPVAVNDVTDEPQWLQLPPENGGGQPIKADPPKDLR